MNRSKSKKQSSKDSPRSGEKPASLYSQLIPFHLQPVWMKDNEFLQSNYRPANNSYWACVKSIFLLHTETFNIWTHLVGCVLISILTLSALYMHTFTLSGSSIQLSSLPTVEKVLFSAFAVSAVSCLLGSASFHIFSCHSESTAKFFNKIDYLGINILITCSSLPLIYYAFFCQPRWILTYCTVFALMGIIGCYLSFTDVFRRRDFRKLRPAMFVVLGLIGLIPLSHVITTRGFTEVTDRYALHWLITMAFSYIFGALIYTMRIPERFFPGKFDIFAHSHQIWHMFVICGIISHYECVTTTASYYHTHQSICQVD